MNNAGRGEELCRVDDEAVRLGSTESVDSEALQCTLQLLITQESPTGSY